MVALSVGCGDDGDGSAGNDAGMNEDGGAEVYECDPVGANPGQGALFNAPLADDVEVIEKEPQHPGDPGPTDLP